MDVFLLQYYMQLHFNKMPAEIRAQYDAYVKANDFRGHMKDWRDKLMHLDAGGKYVQNTLPDPEDAGGNFHLTDSEWEKLFNAFQNAFRAMAADKKSFKDNKKANDFLDEYFGAPTTHLFSNGTANSAADQQIQGGFKNFLTTYRNGLEIYLKQWGLVDGDFSYSDLLSGIDNKKYNSSPDFQNKIKTIAQYVTFYARQADFQNALGLRASNIPDFSTIETGFDGSGVNLQKLDYFKRNYKDLLNTLHDDSKVYDVFRNYDKGKLSKPLDEAKSKVDYANRDSDDYVPAKRDDELTPWQQLSKTVGDTWSDYMDKYVKMRSDRLYFSPSAKLIVKALDGTKFKPTDGLAKVLENAKIIKDNLQYKSPTAVKHFEWLEKSLNELKDMKQAFAGALKNGRQMKALISELTIKAIREGKEEEELKTAMEVLSVIKYGYTTSKIMDTLRNENLSIFSDGGLSWNKNKCVEFVTTAMDKSIKAAFMGVGYMITVAGNAYKLSGSKFNANTGRMKNAHDAWVAQNAAALQNVKNRRDTDVQQQKAITNNMAAMRARGITETALDSAITQYGTDISSHKAHISAQSQHIINTWCATNPNHADAAAVITYLDQLTNETYPPTMPAFTDPAVVAMITPLYNESQDIQRQTRQMNRKIKKRQEFENGANTVSMLDRQILARDKQIDEWDDKHKDKYRELMAYWDFLESGRNTHTGKMYSWMPGSAKNKQSAFDKKEDLLDSNGNVIIDPATGLPKQDLHKNILFSKYLEDYQDVA